MFPSKPLPTLTDLEYTERTEVSCKPVKLAKLRVAGLALTLESVTAVFTTSV